MWNKLKDFTESHYRGVLAVNLAALLFIGTALFYGVIAVRDMSTYDEIIVKADLQPTCRLDDIRRERRFPPTYRYSKVFRLFA